MLNFIKEDKSLYDEDNMAEELVEALFLRFKSDEKDDEYYSHPDEEEIDI